MGLLFESFASKLGELLLFGSGSPLIIGLERTLQNKIEFIRPCIDMNKKLFSHFISETITFCIIV